MIDIQCSWAKHASKCFAESGHKRGENNVSWIQRHYPDVSDDTILLLFGGIDVISLRLRMAQAKARQDYSLSHWSHIALMRSPAKTFGNTTLFEIRLDPLNGFGFPPASNAVQRCKLKDYSSTDQFPNVAILRIPVSRRKVMEAEKKFRMLRNVINGVDMLTAWLAYVWGATGVTNPLVQDMGIPSAVFVEHVVAAGGFDLTPGLASRASCPEAIWQSAKWWHEFYETSAAESNVRNRGPIHGQWATPNQIYTVPDQHNG